MKQPRYAIIVFFMLILSAALSSCSDDLYLKNEIGSVLTENSEFRISSFKIKKELWDIPADISNIDIYIRSCSDGTELKLPATVEHGSDCYTVSVMIPKEGKLADGDYSIRGSISDKTPLGTIIEVTVKDEMIYRVLQVCVEYSFKGDGSKDSPYLIEDSDCFDLLLYLLARDSITHARGLYFKQTADFSAPAVSNSSDGRLYSGFEFAGIYDGDNHRIKLSYIGKSSAKDNSVGLFSALRDSAEISNLHIESSLKNINKCGGILAGESTGAVAISNVYIEGEISGVENVGAFIGNASGTINISNCTSVVSVTGAKYVGGAIGNAKDCNLTVSNFSTKHDDTAFAFVVTATESHAGGIAGLFNNGYFQLDNVKIRHTIPEDDKDLEIVAAPIYCGGLIGEANVNAASKISSCEVVAPLHSKTSYLGGYIGKATLNANLNMKSFKIGTYLEGVSYVGGAFGYVETNGHLIIEGNNGQITNYICKIDGSHCCIVGKQFVGGVFGYIKGNVAPTSTKININVSGSDCYVGGVAGYAESGTIDCSKTTFEGDMEVLGTDCVGGVAGYANSCTVTGNYISKKDLTSMPQASDFPKFCPIKVCYYSKGVGSSMGGIVGEGLNTSLKNLCFSGTVTGCNDVGGIVGNLTLRSGGGIVGCVSNAKKVENIWSDNTGGVAGVILFTKGEVDSLANYTEIVGSDHTGGIIGKLQIDDGCSNDCNVRFLYNSATVSGTCQVGGCIGYFTGQKSSSQRFTLEKCGNVGEITSSQEGNVGGIIGYANRNYIRVFSCANHGNVKGNGTAKVGGIAGRLGMNGSGLLGRVNNMRMAYCCNRGTISSESTHSNVGGLLGYQEDGHWNDDYLYMTHDCYNAGSVPTNQKSDNGGIIGYVDNMGEVVNCINFGKVEHGNAIVGTHKSGTDWYHHYLYYVKDSGKGWCADSFKESDRTNKGTFKNFNFNVDWNQDNNINGGYPYLRDCPFQFKK
ncbi:MAG: hypothetical protein ACI30M_00460 [Muribaculaceae bacterium]